MGQHVEFFHSLIFSFIFQSGTSHTYAIHLSFIDKQNIDIQRISVLQTQFGSVFAYYGFHKDTLHITTWQRLCELKEE